MSMRAALYSSFLAVCLLNAAPYANAQEIRQIETTENSDYFGFDLRTEQNVALDECKKVCIADSSCRAFTYNIKAQWCFLKSDYNQLKSFTGAIAGKVVDVTSAPDIGAPAVLSFVPASLLDEARQYKSSVIGALRADEGSGLAGLIGSAESAYASGDPASAVANYSAALTIASDDVSTWLGLTRAALSVPANANNSWQMKRAATSAAINAYQLSRSLEDRAETLTLLAKALELNENYRPALDAYKARLTLQDSAEVRAQYIDLRARKGFRVIEHTVDSDSAAPRVCAQFSEPLVKTGIDYSSYVTVDDAAPKGIEAKDREICVEGLQHGKNYRVVFRPGLPAAIGEMIEAPVALNIYIRDRAPAVRFTGDSFVLPSSMRRGIPVVSVNTSVVDVNLYRVGDRALTQLMQGSNFLGQLDGYSAEQIGSDLGEPVWKGKLDVKSEQNKEVVTSFPVDEALPQRKSGVYVLTAMPEGDRRDIWDARATQWFLVSDIGLATFAGDDGLNVFARSLETARPLSGVQLQLLANNNEILGTATTDKEGRATFTAGLLRGTAGMTPAIITARNGDADYVFLDMKRAGFDLSDRGVTGRSAPGAIDVYGWTERGIYRVGETVHAAALARDVSARAIENLPLTFSFRRPDGMEDRAIVSKGEALGGHAVELPLASNAMRGTWTLRILSDPKAAPLAEKQFLVEDFVPDRIEFDLASDVKEIVPGQDATVTVDGRYLYGAPAAGLTIEGEINIKPTREWQLFPGYVFGLVDEEAPEDARITLDDLPPLDDRGQADISVNLDELPATTQRLAADIAVRMREGGGRAVERRLELPIAAEGPMIGLKPEFSGDQVPENSNVRFKVLAADEKGVRQAAADLQWSLIKVERNYQWYRSGNSWNYEPVVYTTKVASGEVSTSANAEGDISVPVQWGRYRLEIETPDPSGPETSIEFDAGWYVAATSTETPDGLEIALDKENYAPGEMARLKISPRFAGELLVTVGADSLLMTKSVSVSEEGAEVEIPVSADWGAGAYVTATLYRPGEAQESRMPARAIGVKWLKVDPGARKLAIRIETPARTEPRQPLSIPVSVGGLKAGDTAYVAIAAVDVGILNLTNHTSPDPDEWYFGQRQLGLEIRDLYGRLIDGSLGAAGRLRTGGDGAQMAVEGSPPTEKLVAFFSGPVAVDTNGKAQVAFDIPQFNGTARVSAVAWTKDAVGDAEIDVVIRDPVVVTAALPKFMAPGDRAQLRLDLANTDGPAGEYAINVTGNGIVNIVDSEAPKSVQLAHGAKLDLTLPVAATRTGDAAIQVSLSHASGLTINQGLTLPVRPAALPVTTRKEITLAAVNGSLNIDHELFAGSMLDGASVSVSVSRSSAFDIPALLMSLDRYPYGCAEQTTSRAMPLLYMSELAKDAGLPHDPAVKERIQDAIYKVLNNQSSSGSFGLWSPGSGDLWLDAYVTDFLTRAREQKYDVPEQAMRQALENLQNALAYDVNIKDNGNQIAYALYVLARNRKAAIGDLRYYSDTQIGDFQTPLARAQLAASLALYGDGQRANTAFGSALQLARANDVNMSRSDYGSALRDGAAILALAAESRPVPGIVPDMIDLVAQKRRQKTYTSTQEQAWMLLAARAIRQDGDAISLDVNGDAHNGNFSRRLSGEEIGLEPLKIVNTSNEPVEAVITTVAAPIQPLPAGGDGFSIERTYYTLDGAEANVTEAQQNERFVVVLKVTEHNSWSSRVLVADLLPAGFEIDNPRLVNSADLQNFEWLGETEAAHSEFRSDRFVTAFDRNSGDSRAFTVAYVVRAVTPGVYAHPAASVEDMYRPQLSARTATGMMEVKAAQ
ncbi:MAG: MG2 domain-containing protein [Phyllobacterium sp.]